MRSQARHARRRQRRKTVDEKLLQRRSMPDPKIRQGLGVHANAAAQPLKRDMLIAQPRNLPRARHALDRCVKPQRQQDARIGRRMARTAFNRLDPHKQRRQVEPFDKAPNHADAMIVRHEVIETNRPQSNLTPLRRPQSRRRRARPLRRGLTRQIVEQFLVVVLRHRQSSQESNPDAVSNPRKSPRLPKIQQESKDFQPLSGWGLRTADGRCHSDVVSLLS
jgi:hypothetical protein